ncbi:AMP-binding protein [Actibacterium sp.]|uniref:AMP-binding protein n=1 Tax=Actibacterium sp. TaxID=1872125 RepID=UPI00356A8BA1
MPLQNPIPGVVYPSTEDTDRYQALRIFSDETMDEAFRAIAARFPDRLALADLTDSYTFAQLDARTDLIAAGLLRSGLRPLDRVIFQLVNVPELVVVLLASLKAGLIPVCTLAAHRMAEIGYLAKLSGARAHVIHGDGQRFDFRPFAQEVRSCVSSMELTVVATGQNDGAEGAVTLEDLADGITPEDARETLAAIPRDARQVAMFQLSGGTSGTPKIIPRFHNEYLYQCRQVARFQGLDQTTVAFSHAPMMHNAPIVCYWGSVLWSGGCVVCCREMTSEAISATLEQHRPNWLAIPLPLLVKMEKEGLLDRRHFAGARISAPGNARRIRDITGALAVPLYGMTEGIISYVHEGDPEDVWANMVGRPISPHDEFRVIDPNTGETLPDGRIGEFVFRGPSSIRGYFDAPERTAEVLTEDGFVRSGDLLSIHTINGTRFLRFEGRVKDVVSRGGEKINCQEIERYLVTHPAISAVAIVPMPDPDYGERSCAFVIPAVGAVAPNVPEVGAYLEGLGVAKYKWPEHIEVVAGFPLTSSGKMSKPLLREMAADLARARPLAKSNG